MLLAIIIIRFFFLRRLNTGYIAECMIKSRTSFKRCHHRCDLRVATHLIRSFPHCLHRLRTRRRTRPRSAPRNVEHPASPLELPRSRRPLPSPRPLCTMVAAIPTTPRRPRCPNSQPSTHALPSCAKYDTYR